MSNIVTHAARAPQRGVGTYRILRIPGRHRRRSGRRDVGTSRLGRRRSRRPRTAARTADRLSDGQRGDTDGVRLPADGVYAGLASGPPGSGLHRAAAISVGTNPTFDGLHRTVEAYLLDFEGDLYDSVLAVRSVRRLRGMLRFAGVSELVSAMARDVQQTRELIAALDPRAFATVPPQCSRVS